MHPRYLPAKLFLLLAVLSFVIGAALNFTGVPTFSFLSPFAWLFLLRTIPIAVGLISANFALVYFELEKRGHLSPNPVLAIGHFITFILAVVGHFLGIQEWTRYLGSERLDPASFSLRPFELLVFAGLASLLFFFASLIWRRQAPASSTLISENGAR